MLFAFPSHLSCILALSLPLSFSRSLFTLIHSALLLSILSYGLSASPSHPFLPRSPSRTLLTLVSGHELAPVSHNQGYCFFSAAACRSLALTLLDISQRHPRTVKTIPLVIAVSALLQFLLSLPSVQTSLGKLSSFRLVADWIVRSRSTTNSGYKVYKPHPPRG